MLLTWRIIFVLFLLAISLLILSSSADIWTLQFYVSIYLVKIAEQRALKIALQYPRLQTVYGKIKLLCNNKKNIKNSINKCQNLWMNNVTHCLVTRVTIIIPIDEQIQHWKLNKIQLSQQQLSLDRIPTNRSAKWTEKLRSQSNKTKCASFR